jgi:NADH-quinone oxidoreductase subunit M
MGVPGTNGFAAEHLIILGAFQAHPGTGLAALFGVILGAAYFVGFFQRAFWGPLKLSSVRTASDLRPRESALAVILIILVFLGGLVPTLITSASAPAVSAWVTRLDAATDSSAYAEASEKIRSAGLNP